jgi:predicted MFS family arabinose efflux permease
MLQRIQTVWLLLATACGVGALFFPFYIGEKVNAGLQHVQVKQMLLVMVLVSTASVLSMAAVFLFNKRKMQLQLVLIAAVLLLIGLVSLYLQTRHFVHGSFTLGSLLPFGALLFNCLAIYNIRKDERLIKSLNRVR